MRFPLFLIRSVANRYAGVSRPPPLPGAPPVFGATGYTAAARRNEIQRCGMIHANHTAVCSGRQAPDGRVGGISRKLSALGAHYVAIRPGSSYLLSRPEAPRRPAASCRARTPRQQQKDRIALNSQWGAQRMARERRGGVVSVVNGLCTVVSSAGVSDKCLVLLIMWETVNTPRIGAQGARGSCAIEYRRRATGDAQHPAQSASCVGGGRSRASQQSRL